MDDIQPAPVPSSPSSPSCSPRFAAPQEARPYGSDEDWRYAVGVGGNRDHPQVWQERAAALLDGSGVARVLARAPAIVTAPVGGPAGQAPYVNSVWVVASGLGPHGLLHLLQAIEVACGRARSVRWGPRTLDLDLLAREDGCRVSSPVLELPHPRCGERAFVLDPWRVLAAAGWWRAALPGASSAGAG